MDVKQAPDKNLAFELLRVTESAALSAARWLGKGAKEDGDGAAVDAMRLSFDSISVRGRIVIGEGVGQNWWCVVYPPLCTAAAADVSAAALAAGFSDGEVRLITEQEGYALRFKAVELWEAMRSKWK